MLTLTFFSESIIEKLSYKLIIGENFKFLRLPILGFLSNDNRFH